MENATPAKQTALNGLLRLAAKSPRTRPWLFRLFYRLNVWGSPASRSGRGSDEEQTRQLREHLPGLLKELQIRSLVDAPCGDLRWMRLVDLPLDRYVGLDIVPELINRLRSAPPIQNAEFLVVDAVLGPIPEADAIFCRDMLVHLPYRDVLAVLRHFQASGACWLLTTTFPGRENREIAAGMWRPLDLQAAPFLLPPPVRILTEGTTEQDGAYADKSLGVWALQEIQIPI